MSFKTLIKKFGTKADLARACGVTRASVQLWEENGYIPASQVPKVYLITGIPAAKLNPLFKDVIMEPKK